MYLVAFVFFIVSVLGLYTQVYGLRVAQFLANQNPVAEQMFVWHENAHRFVQRGTITPADLTRPAGCWLTMIGAGGVAAPVSAQRCRDVLGVALDLPQPPGYQAADWSFNTIAYQPAAATVPYAVTWIPNPAGAGALITRPNPGYTLSDVVQQMQRESRRRGLRAFGSASYFGYVQAGAAAGDPNGIPSGIRMAGGGTLLFPIPTDPAAAAGTVPAIGDFALVSVVSPP